MSGTPSSEIVTISVKAGDRHGGEGANEESSSATDPVAISEGVVEIPKEWLIWPWFEAKLKRWNSSDEPPHITLEIPEGDVAEGARLLGIRLNAHFQTNGSTKAEGHTPVKAWSSVEWWWATNGQVAALSAALHVFHMTMLEDWALEVAQALETFALPCPRLTACIADELKVTVVRNELPQAPFRADISVIKRAIREACHASFSHADDESVSTSRGCKKCQGFKLLAERSIFGSEPSKQLVQFLVGEYFNCFHLDLPNQAPLADNLVLSLGKLKKSSPSTWLARQLLAIVRRRPGAFLDIVEVFGRLLPTTLVRDPVKYRHQFTQSVCELVGDLLSVLFVSSALNPDLSDEICSILQESVGSIFPISFHTTERGVSSQGSGINPEVFSVATLAVQQTFLKVLPVRKYKRFYGKVHLVHEGARHLFVGSSSGLSAQDLEFLSMATFPGIDQQEPESQKEEETLEERRVRPPKKKARRSRW